MRLNDHAMHRFMAATATQPDRPSIFNIYHASLVARDGSGVGVDANADVPLRACLASNGVKMHPVSQCPLASAVLKDGAHLTGHYNVRLMARSP